MKKLFVFALLLAGSFTQGQYINQDLKTNTGGIATFTQPSGLYTVILQNINRNLAVDLLVDYAIQARFADPQQINIYIVQYYENTYWLYLDERIPEREGYPMQFSYFPDLKYQLKEELKLDFYRPCLQVQTHEEWFRPVN